MARKYERSGAGAYLKISRSVTPAEKAARFAERESRESADDRTEAERWLGDPPRDRSALPRK
jgi:hypothetical protein